MCAKQRELRMVSGATLMVGKGVGGQVSPPHLAFRVTEKLVAAKQMVRLQKNKNPPSCVQVMVGITFE
jgi:hypothetical protein